MERIIGFQFWYALVIAGIGIHCAINNPSYHRMGREYLEFTITNHRHSKRGETGRVWFMLLIDRGIHPDEQYAQKYKYSLNWTLNIGGKVFTTEKYTIRRG